MTTEEAIKDFESFAESACLLNEPEQEKYWSEVVRVITSIGGENKKLNQFAYGTTCMARNTLASVKLVRNGTWTLDDLERWLNAVITNDAKYLEEAERAIHAKLKGE